MTKKIALLLCLVLPWMLQAQKKSIRTDRFQVTYEGDWNPTFEGTYHYYVDDDYNTLWHGSASVNQTRSYTDDFYSYGDFVDTYTDSRTLKVNANYKDGKLDGLFSLNNSITYNFRYNRDYNSFVKVSLTTNNKRGVLNGNCKLVADVNLQGNKAKINSSLVYDNGRVVKYDEVGHLNGKKETELHLTFDENGIVSGTLVNEDWDIKFKNGYAIDRYMNYSGYVDDIDAEKRAIVLQLAEGSLLADSLIELGYILFPRTFSDANDFFLKIVNDDSFVNYNWWNGGDSPFNSMEFNYWILKEIRLKSYSEFYEMIKPMSVEELDKLQKALENGNSYEEIYLSNQTRSMILADIPTLKTMSRERTRNAGRQKVMGRLESSLSGKKYDNLELTFSDNDDLEAVAFDVYTDYSNGLGYKTTHCTLSNLNNYLPTVEQVQKAVAAGTTVPNGWEEVQARYKEILSRHSTTVSTISSASFDDILNAYRDYYLSHINNINVNTPSAALAELDAIYGMQGKYARLTEVKRIIISNNGIILNMDVKHADHIIEAYQSYYNSLSHAFIHPDRIDEMMQIVDVQTRIISALRSDDVKKLDKKVKKSDDKSISTVLQLLSGE